MLHSLLQGSSSSPHPLGEAVVWAIQLRTAGQDVPAHRGDLAGELPAFQAVSSGFSFLRTDLFIFWGSLKALPTTSSLMINARPITEGYKGFPHRPSLVQRLMSTADELTPGPTGPVALPSAPCSRPS